VVVAVGVERFQVPDILMNTDPVKHLLSGRYYTHTHREAPQQQQEGKDGHGA
jgi:hypothetical protein